MTALPFNESPVVSIPHRSRARDFIFSSISHGLYPEAVHMLTEIGYELLQRNQHNSSALTRVPLKPSDVTFLSSLLVCPDTYLAGALAIDRSDEPRIARHSLILKLSAARLLKSLSAHTDPRVLADLFGQGLRDNRNGNIVGSEPFHESSSSSRSAIRNRTPRINYNQAIPAFDDQEHDADYNEDRTGRKRKRSRSRRGSGMSKSTSRSRSRASSAARIGAQDEFEEQEYNEEQQVQVDDLQTEGNKKDPFHLRRIDIWHRLGYLGFWNIVGHAFIGSSNNYYLELVNIYADALERDLIFNISAKDAKDVTQLLRESLLSYILRSPTHVPTASKGSPFEYTVIKDALDAILADKSRKSDFPPLYKLRKNTNPDSEDTEMVSADEDFKSFEPVTCSARLRLLSLIYQFLYIYSSFNGDSGDAGQATPAEIFLKDISQELSKIPYEQQLYFVTPHPNVEGTADKSSVSVVGVHGFLNQFQILLGIKLLQPLVQDPLRDLRVGNIWPLGPHSDDIQMLVSMQLGANTLQRLDKVKFAISLMTTVFRNWQRSRWRNMGGQTSVEIDETEVFLNRLCLEARLRRKYEVAQAVEASCHSNKSHSETENLLTYIQLLESGMELYS